MADGFHYAETAAASWLGVSPRTLASWRRAGRIGYHRTPGGRIFYTADQLANCVAKMRVHPVDV